MKSKKETTIKLILIIFFLVFFGFLFWYFYKPTGTTDFFDESGGGFNLFPFGFLSTTPDQPFLPEEIDTPQDPKDKITERPPRLRQISKEPTAGVYFDLLDEEELKKYNKILNEGDQVSLKDQTSEIRYILSKNSHVYSTYTNTLQENRISNITIPKIYETLFFDKDNFIVRYLNQGTIKSYSIILADKTEEELAIEEEQKKDGVVDPYLRKFNGLFLPNDILEITGSPVVSEVFYLSKNKEQQGLVGTKSKKEGGGTQDVSTFDFSEWNIAWVSSDEVLFTSKPSKNTHSISMVYNLKDNSFLKISKALLGGNTLANNDFSKILYSGIINNKYTLLVYNLETQTRKYLDRASLVEKCVWSHNNIDIYCAIPSYINSQEQPDAWYRGYNYFVDNIYKINTESGESQLVYFNFDNNPDFDITDLKLDEVERYIYWIDKNTNFAWSWELFNISPQIKTENETEEVIE